MDVLSQKISYILDVLFPKTAREKRIGETSVKTLAPFIDPRFLHEDMLVFFHYKEPCVKELLWALKYQGKQHVAEVLGETMYPHLCEEIIDTELFDGFSSPIIIPIPLGKQRLKKRGFNQSELIAKALVANDPSGTFSLEVAALIRYKETGTQAHVENKSARQQNVSHAFKVIDPSKVRGNNILLLDDIVTTGSTARAARDTLLKAGARQVVTIAVAH